jgi:hypothetical protein
VSPTLDELKQELKKLDEVTLLEVLDITTIELVEYLDDYIDQKQQKLFRTLYG